MFVMTHPPPPNHAPTITYSSGKSTLIQVLKLLLADLYMVGTVEEISQDDFLSSQQERAPQAIKSRWDINSTNEDFVSTVLEPLVFSTPTSEIKVPVFIKSEDDRDDRERTIVGKVDVILFEGWRVGCRHPNFLSFSRFVDTMLYIKVESTHTHTRTRTRTHAHVSNFKLSPEPQPQP